MGHCDHPVLYRARRNATLPKIAAQILGVLNGPHPVERVAELVRHIRLFLALLTGEGIGDPGPLKTTFQSQEDPRDWGVKDLAWRPIEIP